MGISTAERQDQRAGPQRATWGTVGVGALAGLVAGLLLTLVQALARLWAGVAPPSELIGGSLDRRAAGELPAAVSHVGLVNAAWAIGRAEEHL